MGKKAKIQISKARRQALNGMFQILAQTAKVSGQHKKTLSRCDFFTDIAYVKNAETRQVLDIYRPKNIRKPLPIVMYIHGGGFTICSKDTHRGLASAYARQGYVVCNVDYRVAPRHQYPAAIEDICHAYKWIVENAARYGGDPSRIMVAGESAGGNLTLALAVACCYRRTEPMAKMVWDTQVVPRAIGVLCGYLQVSEPQRLKLHAPPVKQFWKNMQIQISQDVSRAYLGKAYDKHHPDRLFADPINVLESEEQPHRPFPRVFGMVGTHDILFHDTIRLEQALKKFNTSHEIRYYPKQGHAFQVAYWRKPSWQYWRDHFKFVRESL